MVFVVGDESIQCLAHPYERPFVSAVLLLGNPEVGYLTEHRAANLLSSPRATPAGVDSLIILLRSTKGELAPARRGLRALGFTG